MQQEIEKGENITTASFIWYRPLLFSCNRETRGAGGLTHELWTMYIKEEEEEEEGDNCTPHRKERENEIVNESLWSKRKRRGGDMTV